MAEGYEHSEEKDYLEEMLDNFAKATELGIIAVNTYGEVFLASKDYYECAYCRQVQDTEVGRARCRRTYKRPAGRHSCGKNRIFLPVMPALSCGQSPSMRMEQKWELSCADKSFCGSRIMCSVRTRKSSV